MDKEAIGKLLPEEPWPGMLKWAIKNCEDDLGPNYLTWRTERIPIYDMDYLMSDRKKPRSMRVAACTCLKCESQMVTEYCGSTLQFWMGEDGEWWPLDPNGRQPFEDEEGEANGYMVEVADGEALSCPMCYETLTAIQAKNLRGGRRKQVLVVSLETVGNYAAVVYWLVRREIFEDSNEYKVIPRDAYVLDERGTIHRYTHTTGGGPMTCEKPDSCWRITKSKRDSLDLMYHDWGSWWGTCRDKKKGGVFYPNPINLDGTTAEKTGLKAYANYEGAYSLHYLKLWKKYPQLENLVNTGWQQLVHSIVVDSFGGYDAKTVMDRAIDISRAKPHEILEMTRVDFKKIRRNGWQWGYEEQILYQSFRKAGFGMAMEFCSCLKEFTATGLRALEQINRIYGDRDLEKIRRYLAKQQMRPNEAGILLDTRNAARALAGHRPLTEEELWPRNLQAAHDRLTRARLVQMDPKMAEKYQEGFDAVVERFEDLQWNDGELCIILPRSYAELVQEGNVLRHCVGGYSEDHIRGRDTIFFVRKYRRPERSYYTLDINMTDRPHRVQLHGYGNERHGVKKEYRHKIPKKVLDFCDRWEREVLMPWWREQQNKQKEGKTA